MANNATAWGSQDFISVWGDGITIQNLTIRPQLDTNKAIEIMGKDFTLRNVEILHNAAVTHDEYVAQKAAPGFVGHKDDWWAFYRSEFAGSVYFYPQAEDHGIGNALLDNVLITQAWISCSGTIDAYGGTWDNVTKGTLTLRGCTTIDFRGAGYAGYIGLISKNEGVIIAEDFHILYNPEEFIPTGSATQEQLISQYILSLAPEGTKLNIDPHTAACEPEVPAPTPQPEKLYRIDIVAGEGGAANPISPTFAAVSGASVPITFTPKEGYIVYDVKVDGVSVGAVKSYTFTNVAKDHKIEVTFAKAGTTLPPQTGEQNTLAGYVMVILGLAAVAFVLARRVRAR